MDPQDESFLTFLCYAYKQILESAEDLQISNQTRNDHTVPALKVCLFLHVCGSKVSLVLLKMLQCVEEDKSKFQLKCIIYTFIIQDKYIESRYLLYLSYPFP
jgi:hypothetical protein